MGESLIWFEISHGYIVIPCLRKKRTQNLMLEILYSWCLPRMYSALSLIPSIVTHTCTEVGGQVQVHLPLLIVQSQPGIHKALPVSEISKEV